MNEATVQEVADRLWKTLNEGGVCDPIRDLIGIEDLDSAYAAQAINTQRKLDRGDEVLGAKIGLTSKAVQTQLGVDQPDYGILTRSMWVDEGGSIPWNELFQPKAEAELGFVLSKDIEGPVTMDSLKDAIESVVPSIEVVGSRIADWNIRITDTIADNASASHFVIGTPVEDWRSLDLVGCKMQMTRRGEVVSEGKGEACLGNPLNAALWLAQTMERLNIPLRKGYVILAGALGPMVPVKPGDEFTAMIDGFESVSVSFDPS